MILTRQTVRLFDRYLCKVSKTYFPNVKSVLRASTAAPKEELNLLNMLNSFNRDIEAGGVVPVFKRALLFSSRVAVHDDFGIYTYAGLYHAAADLCKEIETKMEGKTQQTISYMCGNDASHVIVQWAIWMSGNIAVPLTPLHPKDMLQYFIEDSSSKLIIASQQYESVLRSISEDTSVPLLVTSKDVEMTAQFYQPNTAFEIPGPGDMGKSNEWYADNDALIIYTSGTTSKPKGVVWTHSMLQTQIASLHTAWQYSGNDVVLHTLPLHHIHGQLNSMNASLAAGARLRMLPSFVSHLVWARLLGFGERDQAKVTVFHGVPSMYAKLAADHGAMFAGARTEQYVRSTLRAAVRLMLAGSAPLPAALARTWEQISGLRLLERYGMSEAGMALSNPYTHTEERTVGHVGLPLPGISARIAVHRETDGTFDPIVTVETPLPDKQISLHRLGIGPRDEYSDTVDASWQPSDICVHQENQDGDYKEYQGELLLKGPGVFTRYLNRESIQSSDFTDGWFRTGDTASFSNNRFRILGRTSIDIIKTGGYKVSALQVESVILEHPSVADAAVIGIRDDDYGEIIAAVIQLKNNASLTLRELKDFTGKKLAPYQLPRRLVVVEEMPRNVMGKLDKKVIRSEYERKLGEGYKE